ncbi:MAG: tetracycline resistance MFS efflux pump [Sphingomonas sp. 28-63-12]|nr:MAG: tetracycline resistance MFS efflux pump [Sphingomonas sp. 28-63-12]
MPIILTAVLIDTIGFGIVIPILPQLITELGHVDLDQATRISGYLLGVYALTQFFAGPVLGNLGDRYGRRPVLIASMLAFSADYALMAFAPTLAWLFLGRAVAGVAGAIYGPASAALADVTPPDARARMFGYISAAFGIGFIIGPAIGGVLSDLGPRAPFVAAAALALINAMTMIFLMPESLAPENRRPFDWRSANVVGAFLPLFKSGDAAPLLIAWFIWSLASNVYPATWSFWSAARFGWDARAIGWSLAFVGLVMASVQLLLTGPIIARLGERKAAVLGLASGTGAFLTYVVITQGWQAYAVFLVSGLSALVFPAMNGLLSRLADASHQGALQGGIGSMNSVAAVIAPLILTQALANGVARGFPGAAFLVAGVLAAMALLIVMWKVIGRVPAKGEVPVA